MGRLYGLVVLLILSLAGMVALLRYGRNPPPKELPAVELSLPRGDGAAEAPVQDPPAAPGEFRELAAPFRDGKEKPALDGPEFRKLQEGVGKTPAERISALVNPAVTPDLAYHDPARHRGEVVRAYGRLIATYPEPGDLTLGVLQDHPGSRTVYFYLAGEPRDAQGQLLRFKKYVKRDHEFIEDWVEIEGVFLRTYDYPSLENDADGNPMWARTAVVFARNLRLAEKPQIRNTRVGLAVMVVAGIASLAAILLVAGLMARRFGSGSLRRQVYEAQRDKVKDLESPLLGEERKPGSSS